MCTAFIGGVDSQMQRESFNLKDITKDLLPQSFTKQQVEKEIHVIDSDGKVYRNVEAIIKIIEEYPRWKILVRIAQLPIMKKLLVLCYKFIAANRHFMFGSASRIFWLKIIIAGGFITGLLLSVKLWMGERFFPLAPVLDSQIILPASIEAILFILLVGLLLMIAVFPKPQKFILLALIVAAVFASFDQMRWQPWFYQYFLMLATLGLFSWNYADIKKQQAVLITSRLIVASLYFFSGLQKVNPYFVSNIFPWMMEPIAKFFPEPMQMSLFSIGLLVPFLEMGIGIGLLIKKYRKKALVFAVLMHGFVLLAIGPLGHSWNSVVWGWNIAMVLFVIILFWKTEDFSFRDIFRVKITLFQKLVIILFTTMPILSFFNLWDSYLSSSLYSGNINAAKIYISDSVKRKLPNEAQSFISESGANENILDFYGWSFDELNVPPYPETRVYKDIARSVCGYSGDEKGVTLVIDGKPSIFSKGHESRYDCSGL